MHCITTSLSRYILFCTRRARTTQTPKQIMSERMQEIGSYKNNLWLYWAVIAVASVALNFGTTATTLVATLFRLRKCTNFKTCPHLQFKKFRYATKITVTQPHIHTYIHSCVCIFLLFIFVTFQCFENFNRPKSSSIYLFNSAFQFLVNVFSFRFLWLAITRIYFLLFSILL